MEGLTPDPSPPTGDKVYTLIGADRRPFFSPVKGEFGGHKLSRIFGRLDCRSAARYVARGTYQKSRVFFADGPTALAAGYRPCAVCMTDDYRRWKQGLQLFL